MLFKKKDEDKIHYIDVNYIYKSKGQPRKVFNEEEIRGLSKSIEENGLLQPVTLRKKNEKHYDIVAGERRVRASIMAGLQTIPCIIIECDNDKMAVLSLLENVQRADLDPFEEAYAIKKLIEKHNLTQEKIAKKLGKSQSSVANKLRILQLTDDEIELIRSANLTERHSRCFIRIKDIEVRKTVINKVIMDKLNVEQTEKLVRNVLEGKSQQHKKRTVIIKDVRIFLNTVSKAIKIMKESGINASSLKNETDDYIEYIVKIPKAKSV